MGKKYYNLTVYCEGANLSFFVDEDDLVSFERIFGSDDGNIEFTDHDNNGHVLFRNKKISGYKKSVIADGAIFENEFRGHLA